MLSTEALKEAIRNERLQRESMPESGLLASISAGRCQEAVEGLVFFTSPGEFEARVSRLVAEIDSGFGGSDESAKMYYLCFVADLVLALRSFLPHWNLQNEARHGRAALKDAGLDNVASAVEVLVRGLEAAAPEVAARLLARWQAVAATRFAAEAAADPEAEAADLVGDSVTDYVSNLTDAIASSNLRRIAEMRDAGQTLTEISNDYAAFLRYALYLGASFATTNPPLVDRAWLADLARWDPVADTIIADNPDATSDELARLMTVEVVLANMRLLRPIFLLTSGGMGCVCLQVNPHNHADADAMISDAQFFYATLRDKLGGGVPNVVFKLPGTHAGLATCRALTAQGIGVVITVNFGLFQHIPFAEAMRDGQAIFSCLVEMTGRLAYPVRDEFLARLDELAEYGIDEALAREAAAWAGTAAIKRACALLKEKGYSLRRTKPLIASHRIYEGHGYDGLPSAFPDMTEILGATILSVFPNVRRTFDAVPELVLEPMGIESPVPENALAVLARSEIFRQSYFVADRGWVAGEEERFRPQYELVLEDEDAVYAWPPVYNTMTQFRAAYDTFVERILERKRLLLA